MVKPKEKSLVTGGAGFIGSHLVDKLIERGHQVVIIDNLSTGKKENLNPGADFHNLDICDFNKINPLFKGIDWVFHLAAIPRVPRSIEDPVNTSRTNILGTVSVFKASADAKVKRVLFSSSSSVYGDHKTFPLKENLSPNPISPYALQKLVGEQFAKLFTRLYSLPIVCLRYFSVFGPRINFDSEYSLVIGKFLKLRNEGKPLTIYDDGEQTRAFCYIDDVVEASIRAAKSKKIKGGEVVNIASETSHTINYLAKLVGGEVQYLPPRKGDIRHNKGDITLARNLLGWEPEVSFEEGLKKTIQWFNQYYGK